MSRIHYCLECGRKFGFGKWHYVVAILLIATVATSGFAYYLHEENLQRIRDLSLMRVELGRFEGEVNVLEAKVTSLESELTTYKLRRPNLSELQIFLKTDQTDKNQYKRWSYVCINFASDLKRNAARAGYNITYVSVNYEYEEGSTGHALNGAYLTDGSWVWIEPQNDKIHHGKIEECLVAFFKLQYVKVKEIAIVW